MITNTPDCCKAPAAGKQPTTPLPSEASSDALHKVRISSVKSIYRLLVLLATY